MTEQAGWVVLIPVKDLAAAKTRLDVARRDLVALAMATDTIRAAAGAGSVREIVVVTDDPRAAATADRTSAADTPVTVLRDSPHAGLNPALRHAAQQVAARSPDPGLAGLVGLAALSGDLPALQPRELDVALAAARAAGGRSFVADASGVGTVLLCACAGTPLDPAFGAGSRLAHEASGARNLTGSLTVDVPGLRRDVDTTADLAAAAALGLGPRTREVSVPDQATVRRWSERTGRGDAVRDDGSVVNLPPEAFAASGLRLLRAGQRVRLEWEGDQVRLVTLLTM